MLERIEAKIYREPNSGGWLWGGAVGDTGYGSVWSGERTMKAHRYVYETLRGPVPHGLDLDHLCRVRSCVNPAHLEPVTRGENLRRSPTKGAQRGNLRNGAPKSQHLRQACGRGHAYTPENTIARAHGQRWCRTCRRIHSKVVWQRVKAARGC